MALADGAGVVVSFDTAGGHVGNPHGRNKVELALGLIVAQPMISILPDSAA